MQTNSNTIIIILGALVVAAGAYWYFFTGTGNEPPLSVGVAQNEAQVRFNALVSELGSISFKTNIFSDVRFSALTDLETPVAPETSGRLDPFASIPGVSGK